jgi:DMATS type aromatic prenyltransferase
MWMTRMENTTNRLGLEKPWRKVSAFLSRFLPGDRPKIDIIAIDCVPGVKNRLKVYFRVDILSYPQLEYFLTLGATIDVHQGLRNAQRVWDAMTQGPEDDAPSVQSAYFPACLIYYELKQGDNALSAKFYFQVQRYHANDFEVARSVQRLASSLSACASTDYSDFIQTML